VLSFVACLAGVVLFSARDGTSGRPAASFAYFVLERSLFAGAAVVAAVGLAALAVILGAAHRFTSPLTQPCRVLPEPAGDRPVDMAYSGPPQRLSSLLRRGPSPPPSPLLAGSAHLAMLA
jgi:hypothetical protein